MDLIPAYQYDASACADSAEEEAVKEEEHKLLENALVDVDKPKIMKVGKREKRGARQDDASQPVDTTPSSLYSSVPFLSSIIWQSGG